MRKSTETGRKLFLYLSSLMLITVSLLLLTQNTAYAGTGINSQINFQGKLVNSNGTNITNGTYNMEFKIYTAGSGTVAGDPGGTLQWTEDYLVGGSGGVSITNGIFQVNLGSITTLPTTIWNNDTIWLSLQLGNTSSCTISTTFQSNCGGDTEMLPMIRYTATPYAENANLLGGLSASNFVQLGQGAVQAVSTSTSAIAVNQQSTGNLVQLQSSGTDAFDISSAGDVNFGQNANHSISVIQTATNAAGKNLTVNAGQGGTGASANAGGTLALQGGAGGGTNGVGGNVTINPGAPNGSGAFGTISLGNNSQASQISLTVTSGSNATVLQFASPSAAGKTLTLPNETGTICTTAATGACSVAGGYVQLQSSTPGTQQTGNSSISGVGIFGTSVITSLVGTSGATSLSLETSGTSRIAIDTSGNLQFQQASTINVLTVGSGVGSSLTIAAGQSGSGANNGGNLILQGGATGGSGTTGSVIIKANGTNSTTAFQVQNAAGTGVLTTDTTNQIVKVQGLNSTAVLSGGNSITSQAFNNGTFWTLGAGWVGSATTATATNATTAATSTTSNMATVTSGVTYEVVFTVTGYSGSGNLTPNIGAANGTAISANGTYTQYITTTSTAQLKFTGASSFTGVLSAVQVYASSITNEAFNNATFWTLGSGWAGGATSATATSSNATVVSTTSNMATVTNGATYEVVFNVASYSGTGTLTPSIGGVSGGVIAASGIYTDVITTTATTQLTFTAAGSFNGVLSGVGVYLISTPSNATLSVLNSDGTSGVDIRSGGTSLQNTFIGVSSGGDNTGGSQNVALGVQSLQNNISGYQNTALGVNAFQLNTSGYEGTAVGYQALQKNTDGFQNVAIGYDAAFLVTTGSQNTAIGTGALLNNLTSNVNTAIGATALYSTTGRSNVGLGYQAGYNNVAGIRNTYLGTVAGYQDPFVTSFVTPGGLQNSAAIGYAAQVQESNALILGGIGQTGANNLTTNVGIGTTAPGNLLSVSPDVYDTGTAYQSTTTVTGVGTTWTSAMVGDQFVFSSTDSSTILPETITGFSSATSLTVSVSQTVSSNPGIAYRIHQPALQVMSTGNVGIGSLAPTANLQVTTQTNTTTALQVQNAAGTAVLNVDTTNSKLSVQGINSIAAIGTELLNQAPPNDNFNNATYWTVGSGWGSATATDVIATTSNGTVVATSSDLTVVAGNTYRVSFNLSSYGGGSVSVGIGGVTGPSFTANGTQTSIITTTGTGALTFTGTNYSGDLSAVSVKLMTLANSVLTVKNSDATTGIELRSGGSALNNTFVGVSAGSSDTTGANNSALGYLALQGDTTGGNNTALGYQSLMYVSTGGNNTATGYRALQNASSGNNNTANGYMALASNSTGYSNSSVGYQSLQNDTSGGSNSALGSQALALNTTGSHNTAVGTQAASNTTIGTGNVGLGELALGNNTSGTNNTAIGYQAGYQDPIVTGFTTSTGLTNSTAIGYGAQVQGSNDLVLGGVGSIASNLTPNVGIGTTSPTNLLSVSPNVYDTGTAYQSTNTITGVGTTWTSAMVGDQFVFSSTDGSTIFAETITGFTSSTSLTGSVSQTVSSNPGIAYRIHQPSLQVTSTGTVGIGSLAPTANLQVTTQTNTTTALQVQNASKVSLFNVGTTTSNLITNPGFENTVTTGWATVGSGTGLAVAANATAVSVYDGNGSLKVTTASNSANSGASVTSFTSAITPGSYTLNFYALGGATNGNFSTFTVTFTGGGTASCTPFSSGLGSNSSSIKTDGFQFYSCSFTSTSTNITAINFESTDAATQHIFYLDDVSLTSGSSTIAQPYSLGTTQLQGIITSPTIFQTASPSRTALQVNDQTGKNILVVDTENDYVEANGIDSMPSGLGGLTIGGQFASGLSLGNGGAKVTVYAGGGSGANEINLQSQGTNGVSIGSPSGVNSLTGILSFYNSTNTNTVALKSGATSSNYTMTLPATGSSGAQCLQGTGGSTTTATTLIFSACSGGGATLQSAYNSSATAAPSIDLYTGSSAVALTVQNDNSNPITGELFGVHDKTGSGLGTGLFTVANTGATNIKTTTNSTTAFQVQNAQGGTLVKLDTTTGTNLVTNSGFEANATNWSAKGTATVSQDVTAGNAYDGSGSLSAVATAANSGMQTSTFNATILPSTQYQLTFWAKCSPGAGITSLTYGRQDVSGTDVNSSTTGACSNATNDWKQFTAHWTTGSTITNPNIYINSGSSTSVTIWIDDVSLVQTTSTGATGYASGSTSALQLQNASGANLFTSDTANMRLGVNVTYAAMSAPTSPVATTATQLTIGSITPTGGASASYSYIVVALTANGNSSASTAGSTATGPTTLDSTHFNTVNWTTFAGNTGYLIYRTVGGTSQGLIGSAASGATSFVDNGYVGNGVIPTAGGALSTSTTYYYKVTAVDAAGGETAPTSEVSAATGASSNTTQTIDLHWTAAVGASAYKVYSATSTGAETYLATVTGTVFTDDGTITNGAGSPPGTSNAYIASNVSDNNLQLSVGGFGTPTSQLYVSGTIKQVGSVFTGTGTYPNYIVTQGNYAYVLDSSGQALQIIDVSNPSAPVIISTIGTGSATPYSIYVQGNYAYVVQQSNNKLQIIDVSNPAAPVTVSTTTTGSSSAPEGVFVEGRYAYVVDNSSNDLQVFDVSNPVTPKSISITTIAGTNPNPVSVYVQGRYAYVADYGTNNIKIFDISNPAAPVILSTISTSGPYNVVVKGRYAYVTNSTNGTLQIIDVGNPAAPVSVSSTSVGVNATPTFVAVSGRYAYVTNGVTGGSIVTFDISNPASPKLLSNVSTGFAAGSTNDPVGISVQGRYAYVVAEYGYLMQVYDLGGEYTQQLEAGGAELGTLSVDGNSSFTGNVSIQSGLSVGQSLQVAGSIGSSGSLQIGTATNSTTAFQVANHNGSSVLNVDTTGQNQNNLITTLTAGGTPSFENGSTTGWIGALAGTAGTCTLTSVTAATASTVGTAPYNGSYMGQCANPATAGAEFKYTTGALTASTLYTLDFYAMDSANGANNATNVLNFGHVENGGGEDVAGLSLTSQNVYTNGWTHYSLTFKTGATLVSGDYLYIKQNDATARSLWIDGVTLQTDTNANNAYQEGKIQVNGAITSPLILQNSTNSTTAFQVQNAYGGAVLSVSTVDTNLIGNSGAEVNANGWTTKASGTVIRDTSQQNYGFASFKITTTTTSGDGAKYTFATPLPNTSYSVGISVKNSGSAWTAGKLVVGLSDGAANADNDCVLAPAVTATVPTTTGWTRFTCTISAGSTTATTFYVKSTDTGVAHTFWVDGIELDSGATLTPHALGGLSINAVVNTPLQLQNQSNNTQALTLQDSSGNFLLGFDTLNDIINIGPTGAVALASTYNIGTTSGAVQTYNIGGTAANVINIGNTQAGGSVNIGAAMVAGTVTIGGGTGATTVNLATGSTGIKTVHIADGTANNVITLGTGQTGGTISIGTGANGAQAITIGGSGTSTGTIILGQGTGTENVNIENVAVAAGKTDTISIGATNPASTGVMAINIGASNTSTGADTVTIKAGGSGRSQGPSVTLGNVATQSNAVCSSLANNTAPTAGTAYELYDCNVAPAIDYAEYYPTDGTSTYGDILSLGTKTVLEYDTDGQGKILYNSPKRAVTELVKTSAPYANNVVGVASNNYDEFTSTGLGIVDPSNNPLPVALNGRIPVNISPSSAPIAAGDYITTSTDPGKGMKATQAGEVIGKALAAWDPTSGETQIMVFVEQGYYAGPSQGQTLQNVSNLNAAGNITATSLNINGTTTLQDLTSTGTATLQAESVSGTSTINNLLAATATIGNLTVSGAANVTDLVVTNSVSAKTVLVSGTLSVTGATELADLKVIGGAEFGQDAKFDSNIALNAPSGQTNAITKQFVASKAISIGEVVVADPNNDGQVTTTTTLGDPAVLGVAVTAAVNPGDPIQIAIGGTAQVNLYHVDSGPNATILAQNGSLVISSATAGAAEVTKSPVAGSILGKALGKVDDNDQIRVLITLH